MQEFKIIDTSLGQLGWMILRFGIPDKEAISLTDWWEWPGPPGKIPAKEPT